MKKRLETVLLVESDSKRRGMYLRTLSQNAHLDNRVHCVSTPEEGLKILETMRFDVIVFAGAEMKAIEGRKTLEENVIHRQKENIAPFKQQT